VQSALFSVSSFVIQQCMYYFHLSFVILYHDMLVNQRTHNSLHDLQQVV